MEKTDAFEQFFVEKFGAGSSLFVIPIFCSLLISFLAGLIDYVTPKWVKGIWVYLIIAVLLGILLVIGMPHVFYGWFSQVIGVVLNTAVGLVFYKLGGQKLVDGLAGLIFSGIMDKVKKKIGE